MPTLIRHCFGWQRISFYWAKKSGKTSVAYNLCKKLHTRLLCNDFVTIRIDGTEIIAGCGDGKSNLTFRSHALKQVDPQAYNLYFEGDGVNVRKRVDIYKLGDRI